MKKVKLLIIDPQDSFCNVVDAKKQQDVHDGELFVTGADQDMIRLGTFIEKGGKLLEDITLSLDSHHQFHIAHPLYWINRTTNERPKPLTIMSVDANNQFMGFNIIDSKTYGPFSTAVPSEKQWAINYIKALEASKRYPHMIWPPHCLIGTKGHNIVAPVAKAIFEWERKYNGFAIKITKGSNFRTEHFGILRAEVVDPSDPSTDVNVGLIDDLNKYDEILVCGEALSHCLANTVRDIANTFQSTDEFIKKVVLLRDCTSSVPGLENLGDTFIKDMTARGMRVSTSVDYLT